MLLRDPSRVAGSLLVALDVASGSRGVEVAAVALVTLAAVLMATALRADRVAERWLRSRARRLPDDIAERLLEEWLAEAGRLSRARKLLFAASLRLTPTRRLVEAGSSDETDALAREFASGARQYVAATLSRRVVASLADFLFWSTLGALPLVLLGGSIRSPLLELLAINAFVVGTEAWLVVQYGGSVGKLLTRLRVIAAAGGPVTMRHALGRALPVTVIGIAPRVVVLGAIAWSGIDAARYAEMSPAAQQALVPSTALLTAQLVWILGLVADVFQAYRDPDHRSLHDLIGGTMVVYRDPRIIGRPDTYADDQMTIVTR